MSRLGKLLLRLLSSSGPWSLDENRAKVPDVGHRRCFSLCCLAPFPMSSFPHRRPQERNSTYRKAEQGATANEQGGGGSEF